MANDLLSLERNYTPVDLSAGKPAPKKKGGNLFTKLLPAGLSAAGIALAPFTGGGSLALLGLGAAGGVGGKILENKLEGQGAFDNPGQIALEGLFGGAGGAFSAVKAARAGKAALAAESAVRGGAEVGGEQLLRKGVADTALNAGELANNANTVASVVPKTSIGQRVTKVGEALKGEARGIKPGVSVPGTSKKLQGAASDKINAYLDELGATKSAHTQYRKVQADIETTGKKIGDLVTTHDRPLLPNDTKVIAQNAATKAKNALGLNVNDQLIVDAKGQIGEAKTLSELRNVRSNLDEQLQNFYKQTERDSTTTATMKVLKGYRDGIDQVLSGSIPGFKDMNTRYATALKASEQLLNKANPTGLRFFGVQTGVGGESVQAAKDLAGRAMGKIGGVLPGGESTAGNVTGNVMKFIKPVAKQEVIHAGGNVALGRGPFGPQPSNIDPSMLTPEEQQAAEQKLQETILGQLTPEQRMTLAPDGGAGAGADTTGGGAGMSYDQLQQLVAADPKNASVYFSLYDRAQKENAAAKPLSSEAAKTTSNAQAGLEGISQLKADMASDPNVVKRTLIPGRGLAGGLLGNVFKTNDFDAARQQVVDVIARLRTGAAISKTEESRFLKFLPQPFDSPDVASQKLGYLERQFQRVAAADPNAATEIQSVLANGGGTQQ